MNGLEIGVRTRYHSEQHVWGKGIYDQIDWYLIPYSTSRIRAMWIRVSSESPTRSSARPLRTAPATQVIVAVIQASSAPGACPVYC